MASYDHSSIEKIRETAISVKIEADAESYQNVFRCNWLNGFAAALEMVAEHYKPIESIVVLVCSYINCNGRSEKVQVFPCHDDAYASIDEIKKIMGYDENDCSDDEIFSYETYLFDLKPMFAETHALTKAKNLLNDFCLNEYGSAADFTDLSEIGIAYTTITDNQIPIQVYADLENFCIERYLDEILFDSRQYDSLSELIDKELEQLDFDALTYVTDEQLIMATQREEECQ